jgi:uncharacterized membrane protein
VVGNANDGGGDLALMWKGPTFAVLRVPGLATGYDETSATGISDDGSIAIGRSRLLAPILNSAIWFPTTATATATALSAPAGSSTTWAISGNGMVIAGTGVGVTLKWSGGGFTTRQTLPPLSSTGLSGATPRAANSDGSVIVGSSITSATTQEAVLWNAAGNVQRISDILTGAGISLTGWILTGALDVSSNGKVVIGTGTLNGVAKSWVARLP